MPTDFNDHTNDGAQRPRRNVPRHSRPAQPGQQAHRGQQRATHYGQGSHAAGRGAQQHARSSQGMSAQGDRPARQTQPGQTEQPSRAGRHSAPAGQRSVSRGQSGRRSAPQQQRQPYVGQVSQPYAGAAQQQPRAARAAQRPQYGQPAAQHPASGYGRNPYAQQNQGYAYSDDAQPVGSYGDSHETVYRVKKKRRSHRGRNIAIGIACAILVLVIAAGAGGYMLLQSARTVKADADQVMTLASGMMGKVEAGDMQGLAADAGSMASLASKMRSETDSPLWTAASLIPVYGSDISAARTLVAAFDNVSNDALVPLSGDIQGISLSSMMSDGRINVEMFQTLAEGLSEVAPVVTSANDSVQAIGQTHIDQVTELVGTAKSAMGTLNGAVDAANQFAPLIPQMLGAGGQTRVYAIAAMSSSEIRAAGGFPGAQGLLTVADGVIELGEFGSVVDIPWSQEVPITDEENALFQGPTFNGGAMKITSGDALYNPDFPHTASRMKQFWALNGEESVAGVIAVDPVFLQYILAVVGGVTSPDGTTVDGTNAARYLMNEVYWDYAYDNKAQDAVFAEVASAAFDKIVSSLGDVDPTAFVSAVQRGVDEHRFLVWMENEQEQQAVSDLGVSGAVLTDPATAQVGVYLNDYSYTKSEYYVNLDTVVGEKTQNADGSATYRMVTTVVNTMDPAMESDLPPYLQAHNGGAYSPGDLMLRAYVYAPAGGTVDNVQVTGDNAVTMNDGTYNGIDISWGEVHLQPGQTMTITYTVTTSPEAGDVPLDVRSTPTAQNVRE